MPHWQAVKNVAVKLPLGHELIHRGNETGVVRGRDQVDHLVHDDALKTLPGLLCEFRI